MCNKCKNYRAKILVYSRPIEISFGVEVNRRTGKLARNTDFYGSEIFDPSDFSNIKELTAKCECGAEINLSELKPVTCCNFCEKPLDKTRFCKYNEIYICDVCLPKINYCRTCPFNSECSMYTRK